jgi:hypothetical protein
MTEIRPEDAAAALRSVDSARHQGAALRRYAGSASTVFVWGLIWLVCNLLSQFFPWGPKSWIIGVPIGTLWGMLHPLPRAPGARMDWRLPLSVFTTFFVLWLMGIVAQPRLDARSGDTLISLVVALAYILTGIWSGVRIAVLGIAVLGAIGLGWFVFPAWLFLWLGIGGGGALILGSIWLARA